jgi:hypothetical protein
VNRRNAEVRSDESIGYPAREGREAVHEAAVPLGGRQGQHLEFALCLAQIKPLGKAAQQQHHPGSPTAKRIALAPIDRPYFALLERFDGAKGRAAGKEVGEGAGYFACIAKAPCRLSARAIHVVLPEQAPPDKERP